MQTRCDILLDLSGGRRCFRPPICATAICAPIRAIRPRCLRAVLKARELTGTFDKPRYVDFTADLCAHSRAKIVGCRRCLDLCPTGAITPNGDHVAIDARICAGCGQCAAACPTGAAAYALPPSDALLRKLRTLLAAYREAGGSSRCCWSTTASTARELIDALARHGDGLPANVLPFEVNEITQVGLEAIAGAFRLWRQRACVSSPAPSRVTTSPASTRRSRWPQPILAGLGFAGSRVATIETDDPDALGERVARDRPMDGAARPASFAPSARSAT